MRHATDPKATPTQVISMVLGVIAVLVIVNMLLQHWSQ